MNSSTVRWLSFVAIAITFLSLVPQLQLWLTRGSQWNGAYAIVDGDEFLYSAYINALIDGRPRRNDPFSGRDDNANRPLPESAFSIQFIPPFMIASLARLLGLSASSAFICLIGVAGLFASVGLFWFFLEVTGDNRIAAVGTLFVLVFGGAAAGQGLLGVLMRLDVSTLGFPFLRRYQPAAAFFLFFVLCTLVCRAFLVGNRRSARVHSAFAGLTLGLLMFSYLYLWSAAAVWFVCCSFLWLLFRKADRRRTLEVLAIVGIWALVALIPYVYLLSNRAKNLDETQTLVFTHRPDPFRIPEVIGILILLFIVVGIRQRKFKASDSHVLISSSLALLPLILFNQQMVTGKSLQPFHFENFIANYAVLASLTIVVSTFLRPRPSRLFLSIAILLLLCGALEVGLPARVRVTDDQKVDQMVPVLMRLRELSFQDNTRSSMRDSGQTSTLVFSPEIDLLRYLPTWTAQGVMVGLGGLDFGTATKDEQKVFSYLYFSGVDTIRFADLLENQTDDRFLNYYTRSAIFGHERVLPSLTANHTPIESVELQDQVRLYDDFIRSFSRAEALRHPITYLIVRADIAFDFSRIDMWYERKIQERSGSYDLYRLSLRPE